MADLSEARRRWWGLFFLTLSAGLVVWGQIVLGDKLAGVSFVVYWLTALAMTSLAIVIALRDLRATRRRLVREQRELLERTLRELQTESGSLESPPSNNSSKPQ